MVVTHDELIVSDVHGNKSLDLHVLVDCSDKSVDNFLHLIVGLCVTLLDGQDAELCTELFELLVLCDEVSLTGNLDHDGLLLCYDECDSTVIGCSVDSLLNCCKSDLLEVLLSLVEIAVRLLKSLLAVHDTSVCDLTECLDHIHCYCCHKLLLVL